MARPIEATPTLRGKDAEIFLRDFEEVNRLMQDPVYRKKQLEFLEECKRLYEAFESRRVSTLYG